MQTRHTQQHAQASLLLSWRSLLYFCWLPDTTPNVVPFRRHRNMIWSSLYVQRGRNSRTEAHNKLNRRTLLLSCLLVWLQKLPVNVQTCENHDPPVPELCWQWVPGRVKASLISMLLLVMVVVVLLLLDAAPGSIAVASAKKKRRPPGRRSSRAHERVAS